jgi:hypothetical protein
MFRGGFYKKFLALSLVGGFVVSSWTFVHARGPMGGAGQERGPMYYQNQQNVQTQQQNKTMQQERKRQRIHAPGTGLSSNTTSGT